MNEYPYVRTYSQVARRTARSVARSAALSALYLRDRLTGRLEQGLGRNRVHFIYLHHVLDDEHDGFRALLARLRERHEFISYSDAVRRVEAGQMDGRYLAFSFDDGLRSCTTAARILDEYGARACFFACPSVVEERDPGAVARFCRDALAMPPVELLDWDDLESLVAAGHEVGSHGLAHADAARLSTAQLEDESGGSYEAFRSKLGDVRHFAWAYGRFEQFSPQAARCVFDTGFESCASAIRGAHVGAAQGCSLCIRREHVVAAWPASHVMYLLARSSRAAGPESGNWPVGWQPAIDGPEG